MKVAEALGRQFFPKRCMCRTTLRQCTTSRKRDDIVVIDVDSDDFGDVIILDVPESFREKFKKNKEPCVIRIDDDDDNNNVEAGEEDSDHTDNEHHTVNGPTIAERDCDPTTNSDPTTRERDSGPTSGERRSDPTTSTRVSPTPAASFSSDANVGVNGLYVGEGGIPVKLSKSKRTYSGKAIPRNRYGLSADSESCSSESDSSDCEVMEDSSGLLREQWEKASSRRRHVSKCSHFGEKNINGASTSGNPVLDRAWEGAADKVEKSAKEVDAETPEPVNTNSDKGAESLEPVNSDTEESATESSESIHRSSEESSEESSESFSSQSISSNLNHDGVAADLAEECTSSENDSVSNGMDAQVSQDHDCSGGSSDLEIKAGPSVPPQAFHCTPECSGAEQLEIHSDKCCSTFSFGHDNGDPTGLYAEKNNYSQQQSHAKQTDVVSTDEHTVDAYVQTDYAAYVDRPQNPVTLSMALDNQGDGNCVDSSTIVTDRQKMKDTEEYKRALEEELAARQEQLQRQAEEAKRLRDRKRAHNMRIMVNERRQKQRVEEIRETRRKDEENLNLKEKLRAEIRIELRKLEIKCYDMASLLRSLGIQVGGGGFFPSPNEVQAAYKRACLKFHPDRFSRTDLRQQVEAEEKFKLISNMKDKFL